MKTKVLTFTYSKINDCIRKILNIWKGLVMLRIIASQGKKKKKTFLLEWKFNKIKINNFLNLFIY